MWIGRRDGNNELIMKDPSLVHPEVRSAISLPGATKRASTILPFQLFTKFSGDVRRGGPSASPAYPTFADGLREQVLAQRILESDRGQKWVDVDGGTR